MGYRLRGLIGHQHGIAHAAARLGTPLIDLPGGFALLPGPMLAPDAPVPKGSWPAGAPFWRLVADWEAAATAGSTVSPIAYVEADFFGGAGIQSAVLWQDATVVLGPLGRDTTRQAPLGSTLDNQPINTVLRHLGVRRTATHDEFDTLALGRHRRTEDWPDDD
jgi:hypothetical protein